VYENDSLFNEKISFVFVLRIFRNKILQNKQILKFLILNQFPHHHFNYLDQQQQYQIIIIIIQLKNCQRRIKYDENEYRKVTIILMDKK